MRRTFGGFFIFTAALAAVLFLGLHSGAKPDLNSDLSRVAFVQSNPGDGVTLVGGFRDRDFDRDRFRDFDRDRFDRDRFRGFDRDRVRNFDRDRFFNRDFDRFRDFDRDFD